MGGRGKKEAPCSNYLPKPRPREPPTGRGGGPGQGGGVVQGEHGVDLQIASAAAVIVVALYTKNHKLTRQNCYSCFIPQQFVMERRGQIGLLPSSFLRRWYHSKLMSHFFAHLHVMVVVELVMVLAQARSRLARPSSSSVVHQVALHQTLLHLLKGELGMDVGHAGSGRNGGGVVAVVSSSSSAGRLCALDSLEGPLGSKPRLQRCAWSSPGGRVV